MRIAILGTRGIPARYGGFETFAEEISKRLVQRGHEVTVYGRRRFGEAYSGVSEHCGVKIAISPTIMQKYLETPLHALSSNFSLFLRRRFDLVLLCNAANSPFSWMIKLRGIPLAINLDGIERRRAKWNFLGRLWYRLGEQTSVWFADRLIADAQVIADYYQERYSAKTEVIAYGASAKVIPAGELLTRFGLHPKHYLLYVSRLEPENNALGVIQGYGQVETDLPLVIVGDAPYAEHYKQRLKEAAARIESGSKRKVVFTGYQFAEGYAELQSNAYLYIQATEVGGTHPALVEAMAYGNCVIANGTPENREVLTDCGLFYPLNDFGKLADCIRECIADPRMVSGLGVRAKGRAATSFDWERIGNQYEDLFLEMLKS